MNAVHFNVSLHAIQIQWASAEKLKTWIKRADRLRRRAIGIATAKAHADRIAKPRQHSVMVVETSFGPVTIRPVVDCVKPEALDKAFKACVAK